MSWPDDGSEPAGIAVVQALRDLADTLTLAGPVLLVIDDLQGADPESLTALGWLLHRAGGNRLLFAAASRPEGAGSLPWLPEPIRVTLTGMSWADATTLIRQRWPDATTEAVGRLWEHTGGNPLCLQALLDENDPQDLGRGPGPARTRGVRPEHWAAGRGAERAAGGAAACRRRPEQRVGLAAGRRRRGGRRGRLRAAQELADAAEHHCAELPPRMWGVTPHNLGCRRSGG